MPLSAGDAQNELGPVAGPRKPGVQRPVCGHVEAAAQLALPEPPERIRLAVAPCHGKLGFYQGRSASPSAPVADALGGNTGRRRVLRQARRGRALGRAVDSEAIATPQAKACASDPHPLRAQDSFRIASGAQWLPKNCAHYGARLPVKRQRRAGKAGAVRLPCAAPDWRPQAPRKDGDKGPLLPASTNRPVPPAVQHHTLAIASAVRCACGLTSRRHTGCLGLRAHVVLQASATPLTERHRRRARPAALARQRRSRRRRCAYACRKTGVGAHHSLKDGKICAASWPRTGAGTTGRHID